MDYSKDFSSISPFQNLTRICPAPERCPASINQLTSRAPLCIAQWIGQKMSQYILKVPVPLATKEKVWALPGARVTSLLFR
jgi:hypothetical protein